MKPFMDKDFLLNSETARTLYHEYAAKLPICDFHCHIDAAVLSANQPFRDLAEAWLGGDHYKWRAMRLAGVPERCITGDADPEEKFMAWSRVLPDLIGNPLYQWTHLELQRYFSVDQPLNPSSAPAIWKKVNDCLAKPDYYPIQLLRQMDVRILCTTDDPVSPLVDHVRLKGQTGELKIVPASRPDRFTRLLNPDYPRIVAELAAVLHPAGQTITTLDDLAEALRQRAQYFHSQGCRLSDHALDTMPTQPENRAFAEQLFQKRLSGQMLTPDEVAQVQFVILTDLAGIYRELGWTMQLHIGALRNTSRQYFDLLGPDTGFDAISDQPVARQLVQFLNACQQKDQLPRTLLYSLNANDNMTLGTIGSTFARDGEPAWVTQGPAWWFHDQKDGMELHLQQYSQTGVLANFVGMSTDSRSLLSYTRHEYFRRIFCNQLGTWVENGEYPADWHALSNLVERVCWKNAAMLFE
jgi:glucuronate isomerase